MQLLGAGLRQCRKEAAPHMGPLKLPAVCRDLSRLQTRLDGHGEEKCLGLLEHRRLRKVLYAPAFLLPGHLLPASVVQGLDPPLARGIQQGLKG